MRYKAFNSTVIFRMLLRPSSLMAALFERSKTHVFLCVWRSETIVVRCLIPNLRSPPRVNTDLPSRALVRSQQVSSDGSRSSAFPKILALNVGKKSGSNSASEIHVTSESGSDNVKVFWTSASMAKALREGIWPEIGNGDSLLPNLTRRGCSGQTSIIDSWLTKFEPRKFSCNSWALWCSFSL